MIDNLSPPARLFGSTLASLVDRLGLQEQQGEGGGAYLPLESHLPMAHGEIGNVRLFTGGPLFRLVTCSMVAWWHGGMVVEPIQLDSHMLFAFTPGNSAVPHFTLDSVGAGEHFAFHRDLISRLDLGANLTYMDEDFGPLTEAYEKGAAIEGLSKAHLSPRQHAIMSPWMLANRATEDAFNSIEETVQTYQAHWFTLLDSGVSEQALGGATAEQLATLDIEGDKIDPAAR